MASVIAEKLNWHLNSIPPATQKALDWFAKQQWLHKSQWYLAGGTALALQVGHRSSVDLDFFIPQSDFSAGKLVSYFPANDWVGKLVKEGTIYGELFGAKVSFIAYPFFKPSSKKHFYGAVRVLTPRDIAVMKIIAVSQRGRKRDFYDLYWYVRNYEPLYDIMLRVYKQYPNIEHNYHHIIESLSYFADADHDPEPKIFFKADWKTVKKFFSSEVKMLADKFL